MMKTTTNCSPAAYPPVKPTRLALAIRRHLALAATACVIAGAAQPAQAFDPVFELSSLDGSNGFVLNGITSGDQSGRSVSGAGDINDDGVADLIIGARNADPNGIGNAGESYVVFGSSSGFASVLDLSALDGSNGFVLNGIDGGDQSGEIVSGAGDIDGDGVADLIIGSRFADPNGNSNAGESYVVFGSSTGFASVLELSALDGSNGFVLNGITAGDRAGRSVSGAGDINGDDMDDLIIGAYQAGGYPANGDGVGTDGSNHYRKPFGGRDPNDLIIGMTPPPCWRELCGVWIEQRFCCILGTLSVGWQQWLCTERHYCG